jgi:hypothetical protein
MHADQPELMRKVCPLVDIRVVNKYQTVSQRYPCNVSVTPVAKVYAEEKGYRAELRKFEERLPHDGNVIQYHYLEFLNAILRETRAGGGRIFYLPMSEPLGH